MDWNDKISHWYKHGKWTAKMVQDAVDKKKITQKQAENIIAGGPKL